MTAAQRETLEAELATCEVAGRSFPLSKANAALADALRAALGTCGNCAHADTESLKDGWAYCAAPATHEMDPAFPFVYQAIPLGERCSGWAAKGDDA